MFKDYILGVLFFYKISPKWDRKLRTHSYLGDFFYSYHRKNKVFCSIQGVFIGMSTIKCSFTNFTDKSDGWFQNLVFFDLHGSLTMCPYNFALYQNFDLCISCLHRYNITSGHLPTQIFLLFIPLLSHNPLGITF